MRLCVDQSHKRGAIIETSTAIMDVKDMKLSQVTRDFLNLVKGIADIDKDKYPETLGKLFIINVPSIFPLVWRTVQVFLDPAVAAKIEIYGNKDQWFPAMSKFIGVENMPSTYGGKLPPLDKSVHPYAESMRAFNERKLSIVDGSRDDPDEGGGEESSSSSVRTGSEAIDINIRDKVDGMFDGDSGRASDTKGSQHKPQRGKAGIDAADDGKKKKSKKAKRGRLFGYFSSKKESGEEEEEGTKQGEKDRGKDKGRQQSQRETVAEKKRRDVLAALETRSEEGEDDDDDDDAPESVKITSKHFHRPHSRQLAGNMSRTLSKRRLPVDGSGSTAGEFVGWADELRFIHDIESGYLPAEAATAPGIESNSPESRDRRAAMRRRKSLELLGLTKSKHVPMTAEDELNDNPIARHFGLNESPCFIGCYSCIRPVFAILKWIMVSICRFVAMEWCFTRKSLKQIRRYLYYAITVSMAASITAMVSLSVCGEE